MENAEYPHERKSCPAVAVVLASHLKVDPEHETVQVYLEDDHGDEL